MSPEPTPLRREAFDAVLFDMDGTLITSVGAVAAHWSNIGRDLGVEPDLLAEILVTMHGTRSIDILKKICPEKATWEYISEMEARLPREFSSWAAEVPGAKALIAALTEHGLPWGIVTSGTRPLAEGWLGLLGIAVPDVLVTAEQSERGKPDPDPYLLGRSRLPGGAGRVLVCEDSPTGIRAGKAAGCFIIAVQSGGVSMAAGRAAGADAVVRDWRRVRVAGRGEGNGAAGGGRLVLEIDEGDAV